MILTGKAIADCVSTGEIRISPFDHNLINPNSYDLRLGDRLLIYVNDILDPRQDNKAREIIIPREGYVLKGRHFYLGHSAEEIGSDHYVPMLHCKSGIARLGLFIHVTADLIDIGSHGNLTLQLHPTLDIRVYPHMRIGQVSFWRPQGNIRLYTGKYQGSRGPLTSKSYLDSQL